MDNFILIIDNEFDDATLSVNNTSALGIKNTQDQRRDYVFESEDVSSDIIITGEWENAIQAGGLALPSHNLSAGATVKIELFLSSVPVYQSGDVDIKEYIPAGVWRAGIDPFGASYDSEIGIQQYTHWFDVKTFDSIVITIQNSTNPVGFIQLPRIVLGIAFQMEYNFSYGASFGLVENAQHTTMTGGGIYTNGGDTTSRILKLKLDWVDSDTGFALLFAALNRTSQAKDILVSAYPGAGGVLERATTFMAKRINDLTFTHTFHNNHTIELVFKET